jgi:hypothetical protein
MAKGKPDIKGLFDKTEAQEKKDDIIKARGVGLKISEWEELEGIRRELGITLHAVTAYAVRYFLKAYREGKIKPEKRTTQNLPEL